MTSYARSTRMLGSGIGMALLLLVSNVVARADEAGDFQAAVAAATTQYRVAMRAIETGEQRQTATEVRSFRDAWHAVTDRAGKQKPSAYATNEQFFGMLMLVDTRIVGALLVIDMGNRDAARNALAPVEEILSGLRDGTPTE